MKREHPDLYEKYYSDGAWNLHRSYQLSYVFVVTEALQAKLGTLSIEAQTKLEKDAAKKEAKAEAKADAAHKKKMVSRTQLTYCYDPRQLLPFRQLKVHLKPK